MFIAEFVKLLALRVFIITFRCSAGELSSALPALVLTLLSLQAPDLSGYTTGLSCLLASGGVQLIQLIRNFVSTSKKRRWERLGYLFS